MQLWPPEKGQTRKFCGRRGVGLKEGEVGVGGVGGVGGLLSWRGRCLAAAAPIVSQRETGGLYLSVAAGG